MTSKHPKCDCGTKKYDYFKKIYRNGTLHMFRKCPSCQKVAQNAMSQGDYDANWVNELPVSKNGVMEQPVQSMQSRRPAQKPGNRVQSRADAIMAKLQKHIGTRNTNL